MKPRNTAVLAGVLGWIAVPALINQAFAQATTESYNQAWQQYQRQQIDYQKQLEQYQQQAASYQKQLEEYQQQAASYQKQQEQYQQQAAIYQRQQADYDEATKMYGRDHELLKVLLVTQVIIGSMFCAMLGWFWSHRSRKVSD